MVPTAALATLIEQVEAVKREVKVRAERIAQEPYKIYRQKEAIAFLGISPSELKRARYEGHIQFHQADDKFWFYQSELIEYQSKFLSSLHG